MPPSVYCKYCTRQCSVFVSHSAENPGRRYWGCGIFGHGWMDWVDSSPSPNVMSKRAMNEKITTLERILMRVETELEEKELEVLKMVDEVKKKKLLSRCLRKCLKVAVVVICFLICIILYSGLGNDSCDAMSLPK